MTRDEAAKIVEDRIKNPVPPVDRRGFWERFFASIKVTPTIKGKGDVGVKITGGTDF
jgi:hypothetical protein